MVLPPAPRPTSIGWEGVNREAARFDLPPGQRTPDWVKVKIDRDGGESVGGGVGGRPAVRVPSAQLFIGLPTADGGLVYRGRVGGGISAATEAKRCWPSCDR